MIQRWHGRTELKLTFILYLYWVFICTYREDKSLPLFSDVWSTLYIASWQRESILVHVTVTMWPFHLSVLLGDGKWHIALFVALNSFRESYFDYRNVQKITVKALSIKFATSLALPHCHTHTHTHTWTHTQCLPHSQVNPKQIAKFHYVLLVIRHA